MRYSYEQLGTGNVSQERIQEVVLQTLFKMAEQEVSQADILRMVNQLLINLEKLILFKKIEQFEHDDIEKFNQQIMENKENYIARELRKIEKAEKLHASIMQLIAAALSLNKIESRYIHKLYLALKRLQIQLQNDYLLERDSAEHNSTSSSHSDSPQKADVLVIISAHYQKLIANHQALILRSRKLYIQNVIDNVLLLQRAIPLLRGMLMPMQNNFINEYFILKEHETIETTKLEQKIQDVLNRSSVESQRAKEQGLFMTRYNIEPARPALNKWLENKKQIIELTLQKVKVLGEKNKNRYINTTVSDEVCLQKLAEFENHPAIKEPLTKHLELTKQQTILIEEKKRHFAENERQLVLLQRELNSLTNSCLSIEKESLQESLQSLDLRDVEFDISQLQEITLVNNLHTKSRPRR